MRRGENIYRRKDGRWEGRFSCGKGADGKTIYKSVYGQSYNEVKSKMNGSKEQKSEITDTQKQGRISEIADLWLSSVKMKSKQSTYSCYRSLYTTHLQNEIGSVRVDNINESNLEQLIATKDHLAPKTKHDILNVLKQIMRFAEKNGYTVNHSVLSISIHQMKKKIRVFTASERKMLVEFLLNRQNLRKIAIYLCLNTGLRIGEVCALQRKHFDLEKAELHVTATMQRIANPDDANKTLLITTEPKSQSSIRDIPLPDYLMNVIKPWYENMDPEHYILTGKTKCMEPRILRNHYNLYLEECEILNATFHTLRHDFATRCVELGMDIKTLSEILGHADVSVTLGRYVHPSMEMKRINMNKLSDGS